MTGPVGEKAFTLPHKHEQRLALAGHPIDRRWLAGQGLFPARAADCEGRRSTKVDPLVCVRCGQRMRLVAFVTDRMAIGRILEHLGLGTPEAAKPPPPAREVLRVAEHADGWGVPAHWE